MRLQQAIREVYGVRLGFLGPEGQLRTFAIDSLRNGFVLPSSGGMGLFGSIIDGDMYVVGKNGLERMKLERKENKVTRFEWLIWEAGKAMIEIGDEMSEKDLSRLALAVERLEDQL